VAVSAAVAPNFFYPPDPSSKIVCSIGGAVAENSGGVHCFKHPAGGAEKLGRRKAANGDRAAAIAAANLGCALQITAYLTDPLPVYHPMTLLDASIRGVRP
jgi:hypothetical protein